MIGLVVFLVANSLPLEVLHVKEPGVVKSGLRGVVTTENENSVVLRCSQGKVLGPCKWLLVSGSMFFVPLVCVYIIIKVYSYQEKIQKM